MKINGFRLRMGLWGHILRFSEDCAMLRRLAKDKADVNERLSGLAEPRMLSPQALRRGRCRGFEASE